MCSLFGVFYFHFNFQLIQVNLLSEGVYLQNTILGHSHVHYSFVCCFVSDMRRDVQEIFRITPHEKQVMMFSATLSKDIRPVCRKFMQDVSDRLRFINLRIVHTQFSHTHIIM